MLSNMLDPLALDVAACLPMGEPGAMVPDLAVDCFETPLFAQPLPETAPADRHRAIRTAIKRIRRILPASVGGAAALVVFHPLGTRPGERLCYGLSARAAAWIRPQLEACLARAAAAGGNPESGFNRPSAAPCTAAG